MTMMEQMQFCAMVLMALLTLTLALPLPKRVVHGTLLNRSRWLMAGACAMLFVQFLLQYLLGLRSRGIPQAVMLNLLLFVPSSWLFSLSILSLQRGPKGLHRGEFAFGGMVWIIVVALMVVAFLIGEKPISSDTRELRWAEVAGSVLYMVMQIYYGIIEIRELRHMRRSINDYFDRDMGELLSWMKSGIVILLLMALLVPIVIFSSGWPLVAYGLFSMVGVYYLVISFVCYAVSNDAHMVQEAGQHAEKSVPEEPKPGNGKAPLPADDCRRIEAAVSQWIADGGHLHSGITIQTAADEMKLPRYQLSAWLKTTEQELFSPWITHLRIEEAKRTMTMHPEWSNDIVAEQCGFGSRSYFQTVFRKQTGMTPMQFMERNKTDKE